MNRLEIRSHLFHWAHESMPSPHDKRDAIEREIDEIPVDSTGKPNLRYFIKPLEHYIQVYEEGWKDRDASSKFKWSKVPDDPNLTIIKDLVEKAFRKRVHGTWGLISKGAEAIPHALTMLKSPNPDIREDGAGILGALGKEEGVVE